MKNMRILLVLFAVILAVGIIGSVLVLQKPESNMVKSWQDGEVLYRLDLSEYQETETIEIAYDGGKNTVLIENGQICMSHADCPDQSLCKNGMAEISITPHCVSSASFGHTICRKQRSS